MITCGNCKSKHETVLQVKDCYNVTTAKIVPATVKKATVPAHRAAKKALNLKTALPVAMLPEPAETVLPTNNMKAEPVTAILKGQDLPLGMYQVGETIYKVKFNKTGTQKYAEKLVITQKHVWDAESNSWKLQPKGKFSYVYGMMNILTSENKMDEAAAKAFHDATKEKYGVTYGFCCVCGKLLTVKKSIAAGIGPVCAGKL